MLKIPRATIDFETEAIGPRPEQYPPKPVGVALMGSIKPHYFSWGHPNGNNCTKGEARRAILKELKQNRRKPVFHHSAFDIEVMEQHLDIPRPIEYEDTLILAYLFEPRAPTLSLKPICAEWLDMPPDERDRVKAWVLANVPEMKGKEKGWGAYICRAPGELVTPYAKGDIIRTDRLYRYLHPKIIELGMQDWYMEEKRTNYVKLDMEQGGIKTNQPKLKRDLPVFISVRDDIEVGIRRNLGITKRADATYESDGEPGFNVNSPKHLARAMEEAGKVSDWVLTKKGNISTSRENLEIACADRKLTGMLALHGVLDTYINTFLRPWLERGAANDGYLFPTFNTVRTADEYGSGKSFGTRTGRPSSSNPNFNNIPASIENAEQRALLESLAKLLKKRDLEFIGLRDYLIPDDGCIFIDRDYAQQESRILAHFEDGNLLAQYNANPKLDVHDFVGQLVFEKTGIRYPRRFIKVINFGIIYGMGVHGIAKKLDIAHEEARSLKRAVLKSVPGIKWLMDELRKLADDDKPLLTWAHRIYYCEEPKEIEQDDGRKKIITFEYKMLNTLIQGSAAECTKRAMNDAHAAFGKQARVVLQVYDQILSCAPKGEWKKYMRLKQEAMEAVKFDLPMLTTGAIGSASWARLKEVA